MNKRVNFFAALFAAPLMMQAASAAEMRGFVHINGSNVVRPFADAVADRISKSGKIKRPWVESNSTGGGIQLFCEPETGESPDIVNASRPMKKSEFEACQASGIKNIVEVKIGYSGLVLAHSKKVPALDITRKELFLALGKKVPDPKCKNCDTLVPNPYKTWKDINPSLPDTKIEVVAPPIGSGIRELFEEAVSKAGCESFPFIAAWKETQKAKYKEVCFTARSDGAYIEESGNAIAAMLAKNPGLLGFVSYKQYAGNTDRLNAARIDGAVPSVESIAANRYPIARPLFLYFKADHVGKVKGLQQYLAEFTNDKAWGEKGYLAQLGLVPMSAEERKLYAADVKKRKPMSAPIDTVAASRSLPDAQRVAR
ncbi:MULTISPECIES: substrate-binding domain-containing protein [Methylocaldum]|uniref:substrate-binding domain-containing protein n=1 Tax=unclassified Methylocaldum TaxID=2622260 RepID=UPI001B4B8EAB|nr:substrate-binding domain-containing protein [Methylocaldum sp. 14B]MBP1149462.1 phosphate transport system substrate-binding protein [Methylocaldum sp. RMAD-M]MDV3240244.1 substrate-binding domain-containing protein [Methylocaldum sp.]